MTLASAPMIAQATHCGGPRRPHSRYAMDPSKREAMRPSACTEAA
jgi:hypothetical protein